MYIYLTNVFLILTENIVFLRKNVGKSYKKMFIWLVSIQFILISGLRSLTLGSDDIGYKSSFDVYHAMTWNEALEKFVTMFTKFGVYENRDMGYYIFGKLFASVCPSYRAFIFFVALLFISGLSYYVYKFSCDFCMSYMIFASFLFSLFCLSAIRQTIAVTICVFIGCKYIRDKKLFKFLIVIFFACLFHQTSVIFLPFYFLYHIKINNLYKFGLPVVFILIFILKYKLAGIFLTGTYSIYGTVNDSPPYNLFFLVSLVVAVSVIFYERLKVLNNKIHIYINAVVCGMFLLELSLVIPIFVRLAYYYILFLAFLIPELFNLFKKRQIVPIKIIFYIILVALLIKTGATYRFMWQ